MGRRGNRRVGEGSDLHLRVRHHEGGPGAAFGGLTDRLGRSTFVLMSIETLGDAYAAHWKAHVVHPVRLAPAVAIVMVIADVSAVLLGAVVGPRGVCDDHDARQFG